LSQRRQGAACFCGKQYDGPIRNSAKQARKDAEQIGMQLIIGAISHFQEVFKHYSLGGLIDDYVAE